MKQLSDPAPRKALHTRQITCTGYERDDGLWEVEGRISDVRTWAQDGAFGSTARPAGEPLHLMSLRLTLDDSFTIVAAEAVTHAAPYADCPDINASYGQLVGLRIEGGFTQAVKKLFRGTQGCTHLTDLLGPIATTALQAINPIKYRRLIASGKPLPAEGPNPPLLNSCHGWRQGGQPAVVRWGRLAE